MPDSDPGIKCNERSRFLHKKIDILKLIIVIEIFAEPLIFYEKK